MAMIWCNGPLSKYNGRWGSVTVTNQLSRVRAAGERGTSVAFIASCGYYTAIYCHSDA